MALTGASTSVVDLSGDTTGLVIAKGTTAERNAISSPQAGMIRNNTETDKVEVYNGTAWRNLVEAGNAIPPLTVSYLVVAGGGGGGPGYQAGGGGAGGLTTNYSGTSLSLNTSTAHAITVGAGGAGGTGLTGSGANKGSNGGNSKFASLPDVIGGGGGASYWNLSNAFGLDGGSGGGAAYVNTSGTSTVPVAGGAATTGQGNEGGSVASGTYSSPYTGAGGGGAGSAGINGTPNNGNGGDGLEVNIIGGTGNYYAGGGGGGSYSASGGVGGSSIGGNGSQGSTSGTPTSGAANTGSGGGGAGGTGVAGADGGSGVVILRYPDAYSTQLSSGGGLFSSVDSTTVAGYKIETITAGSGTITFS